MTYVIGYPLISEEEIIDLGYHNPLVDRPITYVHTRDITQLLVELDLFSSRRLARSGTPEIMHKIYEDNELDIIEWRRKNPWPCVFTFIVGASTREIRDNRLMDIGAKEQLEGR